MPRLWGVEGSEGENTRGAGTVLAMTTASGTTRRRSLLPVLLIGVIAIGGLLGWIGIKVSEKQKEETNRATERERIAAEASRAVPIEVTRVVAVQHEASVLITGTLEPVRAVDLGFELGGQISRVGGRLGDTVVAGQTLATLDRATVGAQSAQTSAAVAAAQAAVEMARDRLSRVEPLARSGAVAQADLIAARSGLAMAEAQLAQARAARRLTASATREHTLRAPFGGVLTRVPSGPGGVVGPGIPIFRIEDLSLLRLRGTIAEEQLAFARVGATVRLDPGDRRGTVRAVVRSLDPMTRRAPIEIEVDNADGGLVGNAFVRAYLMAGTLTTAFRIPATARNADGRVAVIGADGRVRWKHVTAEIGEGGNWLVTQGMTTSDRVVVRPTSDLREGDVPAIVMVDPPAATRAAASPAAGGGDAANAPVAP